MTIPSDHNWALVLAAGSGTRLSSLTTDATGETVPKQFCSLNGRSSLLSRTLERASRVVPWSRTVMVVAAQHRRHWQPLLPVLADENIVVQPENKGTGIGILLPLLHILNRDPDARVVLLPSDHHIDDERTFLTAVAEALASVDQDITLLGITPEYADPELGYIVAGSPVSAGRSRVARFVEKPTREIAECLVAGGAQWNSFVIVAQGLTVLELIAERYPQAVLALCDPVVSRDERAIAAAYTQLPQVDFSRDVVAPAAAEIRCLSVPACGWTDLGTPHRVAECLSRQGRQAPARGTACYHPAVLDLAEASRRRQVRSRRYRESFLVPQLVGEIS